MVLQDTQRRVAFPDDLSTCHKIDDLVAATIGVAFQAGFPSCTVSRNHVFSNGNEHVAFLSHSESMSNTFGSPS